MKTKKQTKQGISLIVLVITVIVMIILAAAIILSLSSNGIIDRANEAVDKTDIAQVQNLASLAWSDAYIGKVSGNKDNVYSKVIQSLIEQNIDVTRYQIDITNVGVTVKAFDKTTWELAYLYNRTKNEWKKVLATDNAKLEGDIIVRFYKTGETTTPNKVEFGNYSFTLPTGDAYKMLIEGTGTMLPLMTLDKEGGQNITGGIAWQYETALAAAGNEVYCIIPYVTEVVVSDGIESIGDFAFTAATSLKKVVLGKGVKKLGISSFQECNALTQINIPYGVESVDNFTFSNCDGIRNISLPNSAKTINYQAFYKCKTLTSIIIPSSITMINAKAFYNCTNLTTVYYTGTEDEWKQITIDSDNDALTNANIVYNYVPN